MSSVQRTKLRIKEFHSGKFGFKSNFYLLATKLNPTSNEQIIVTVLHTFLREQILFLSMTLFKIVAASLGEKSIRLL